MAVKTSEVCTLSEAQATSEVPAVVSLEIGPDQADQADSRNVRRPRYLTSTCPRFSASVALLSFSRAPSISPYIPTSTW
jgi:hypothetical protein